MAIVIHILYTGTGDHARSFAQEMTERGLVEQIRSRPGNLGYAYYFPLEDANSVLLIDSWENPEALDRHHASPVMQEIIKLREKYDLSMQVTRMVRDERGVPEKDRVFIRGVQRM